MPIHRKLLFVLADAEHVRFVRPELRDNTLHSFSRALPDAAHRGETHHAHERDHASLPTWIASELNDAAGTYDDLVLVAPPHALAAIRDHLSPQAVSKITGTVEKDLTKQPDAALWPHLHAWVRPVHREALV